MGFEYRIAFVYGEQDQVLLEVSRLSGAAVTQSTPPCIEFRQDAQRAGMPDAIVCFEDYGLYFCDNGVGGRNFLGYVVARLVSCFGPVLVSELE